MAIPVSSVSSNCTTDLPISGDVFLNIPAPIINDILARLTPVEVLRCRCVCKPWLELLSEPDFVNLHLSKSQTAFIVHNQSTSPNPDSSFFSLVQVEDETNHHDVRFKARMDRQRYDTLSMIGSVNGLVCINEYDLIHVWNPIMGDFIRIQTPGAEMRKYPYVVTTYGFGISSGKYQVVKIQQKLELTDSGQCRQILDSTCHVYTVGTGFWKKICHAPYFYSRCEHGLFLNGNLHWMVYDENRLDQIFCLDLESESFWLIPPPPELPQSNLVTLSIYKGCISLCDNSVDYDIVIWVMKEYGVQNSWTKEVVISKHLIDRFGNHYSAVRIVKVFEDGEILLLWRNDILLSYHPKRNTVQDLDVEETMTGPCSCPCIEATSEYVSSIVSLKNLGELNVNRA